MSVEEAKQKVAELVAKYQKLSSSEVKSFNESNTKQGFIEPLFKALGWDVDDTNEVTLEENVSNKRVDYAFKLHGVSQFYLEAKPLKADLTNPEYIKQAVTYAYSKGVTWVVLTDFEELRLFNAQQNKPFITLNSKDYAATFDKLWLLSRESLAEGLLNKEAAQYGALPPSLPVETRLFRQLRQWREELFNQLHLYNKALSFSQIDEVIQKLFNRLIFIRTAEDRGIEDKRLLAALHQWRSNGRKGELLEIIRKIFHEFDGYYDSDLFARHLTDTAKIDIENDTIERIIDGLYEIPGSLASYDFNAIDADVLGTVYEQYLGYVASVVKQRAKEAQVRMDLGIQTDNISITSKKEHRKEQGIYYTPKFVTDYIVKETVGRFLQEHSVNEIRNIKILDPACGSGSFLIRAFDELLRYYANQKTSKSEKDIDAADRISILTSNIFGVDLDIQAVEIARLNLLLRSLAKRDLLPSLTDNIRQGNSLISGTEEELKKYFGASWHDKKPFNWDEKFKDIMANGGFDVVIGNPPWVSLTGKQKSLDLSENELQYLYERYSINTYSPNLYEAFIRRGMNLLKDGGFFSFIVPDRVASNQQFIKLREDILREFTIRNLLFRFPFPGVIADTMVFVIRKVPPEKDSVVEVFDSPSNKIARISQSTFVSSSEFQFLFVDPQIADLFSKISRDRRMQRLDEITKLTSGCGAKSSMIHTKPVSKQEIRILKGENIGRYENRGHFWFQFDKDNLSGRTRDEDKLGTKEKVLIRKTGSDIIATFDNSGIYPEQSLYFLYDTDKDTLFYLLAILNSKLINAYYKSFAVTNRDTTPQLKNVDLDKFPIADSVSTKIRNSLVALVDKMLELNKKLAPIRDTPFSERDDLKEQIKKTDREIDNLVYELYGLTKEERQVIEASVTKS